MQNSHKVSISSGASAFISGGIAGICAKTTIAPLERVKILYQIRSTHYPYSGIFSTISSIAQKEGITALWKGNLATLIRVFPYAAIQFFAYDGFKRTLTNTKFIPSKSVNNFIAGSMAGATAVLLTYPLDLVRVKLAVDIVENQFKGVVHCIKTVHNEQGIRGLYKGMSPTLLGIIPYAGVNFASYEFLKSVFEKPKTSEFTSLLTKLTCVY